MEIFLEYLPFILHFVLLIIHIFVSIFSSHSLKKYICKNCGAENAISDTSLEVDICDNLLRLLEKYQNKEDNKK